MPPTRREAGNIKWAAVSVCPSVEWCPASIVIVGLLSLSVCNCKCAAKSTLVAVVVVLSLVILLLLIAVIALLVKMFKLRAQKSHGPQTSSARVEPNLADNHLSTSYDMMLRLLLTSQCIRMNVIVRSLSPQDMCS